jgi:hypothetical protein
MSIYGSLPAPADDEHDVENCAYYVEDPPGSGCFEFSGEPCDCGQADAPLVYQGSHVLPSEGDERRGYVDIACIPAHVRYWRDNPNAPVESEPNGPPEPFLRFGVNEGTVVLTRRNVEQVHETLAWWLEATKRETQDVATAAATKK